MHLRYLSRLTPPCKGSLHHHLTSPATSSATSLTLVRPKQHQQHPSRAPLPPGLPVTASRPVSTAVMMTSAVSRCADFASTSGRGLPLAWTPKKHSHRAAARYFCSGELSSHSNLRLGGRHISTCRVALTACAAKGASAAGGSSSTSTGVGFSSRNAAPLQQSVKPNAAASATATQAPPSSKGAERSGTAPDSDAASSVEQESQAQPQEKQEQDTIEALDQKKQEQSSGLMGIRAKPEGTTSSSVGDIYNRPELYDIAFSYRAFKEEFAFLRAAYKQHTDAGSKLVSVLELGCGPARHAIGLAKGDVEQVSAVDLNKSMLEYAKGKAASAKVPEERITFVQGDMSSLGDQLQGRQHDMVLCLLGTFSHMLDNAAASRCFGEVARHLAPHGVFVLELAHPGDLFDGTFILGDGGKEVWEVPAGPGKKVLVEWGAEFDNFDPVTQVMQRTVSINVFKGDELQEGLEEVVPYRQFTVQEIDLLATAHGLKIAGLYGEMNLNVDLGHEEAYRMVMVLKHA